MCRACDIKISEMVEFLNSDREHMQQGIFPDVQQSYLLHSALNFDEVKFNTRTACACTCMVYMYSFVAIIINIHVIIHVHVYTMCVGFLQGSDWCSIEVE